MISVEHVSKYYGPIKAVDDVSFTAQPGSIMGLLGPNGAGKTTLMRILTGYHAANRGRAFISGFDVSTHPVEVKSTLGYLPESVPLYTDCSVTEYLRFIAESRRLSSVPRAVDKAIEECGLSDARYRLIDDLSKGYRQRVGLAQAVIHDPKVIILDEPTSGLDPNQIIEIRSFIQRLKSDKTIILSTHIMQEVEALCSQVMIINKGSCVSLGTVKEITKQLYGSFVYYIDLKKPVSQKAYKKAQTIEGVASVEKDRKSLIFYSKRESAEDIFHWAVAEKCVLLRLELKKTSLEDVFVSLTKEKPEGGSL